MPNEGYLSYFERLKERLTSFHKHILKNYLRPLGANPLDLIDSDFGPRTFRSPLIETKPSICQSVKGQTEGCLLVVRRKAISSGSIGFIRSFLPKYRYLPMFMKSPFHETPHYVPLHLDSEAYFAAGRAKSERFPTDEEIFFPPVPFHHTAFHAVRRNKTANINSKMPVFPQRRSVIPSLSSNNPNLEQVYTQLDTGTPFAANTAVDGTREHRDTWGSEIASDLPDQGLPSFPQGSTRAYLRLLPEIPPILRPKGPTLRTGRFTPMEEEALGSEKGIPSSSKKTDGPSLSPEFTFVKRSNNASGAFQVRKVEEDANSRGRMSCDLIGFESYGLSAPVQSSVDYELIADRVYEIIENRLRVEKERE